MSVLAKAGGRLRRFNSDLIAMDLIDEKEGVGNINLAPAKPFEGGASLQLGQELIQEERVDLNAADTPVPRAGMQQVIYNVREASLIADHSELEVYFIDKVYSVSDEPVDIIANPKVEPIRELFKIVKNHPELLMEFDESGLHMTAEYEKLGIDIGLFDAKLSQGNWEKVFKKAGKIGEWLLQGEGDIFSISQKTVGEVLSDVRRDILKQRYIHNRVQDAHRLIRDSLGIDPSVYEAVVLINPSFEAGTAAYEGNFFGVDYISIRDSVYAADDVLKSLSSPVQNVLGREDLPRDIKNQVINDVSSLVHEILHQIHFRKAKKGGLSEENINITRSGISDMTLDDFILTLDNYEDELPEETDLGGHVAEGVAVFGTRAILMQEYNRLIEEGNKEGAELVMKAIKNDIRSLKWNPEIYMEGVKMIKKLIKRFGYEGFLKIVNDIDMEKCSLLDKSDPQFGKIISDPRLLPGLEVNDIVRRSLEDDPVKEVDV
ncbi:hypothetical protein JW978_04425 [Candidatus Dojkabacteria bacterium]|nr:hypothetical protein [Candidatus Dojkabacteria bacterium]